MASNGGGGPSVRQLDLLRKLAAREAARRQAEAESKANAQGDQPEAAKIPSVDPAASPSTSAKANLFDTSVKGLDARSLERLVRQEKARNDVAWAKVREEAELLSDRPSIRATQSSSTTQSKAATRRAKETQLALIEYEIAKGTEDLEKLDAPHSDAISSLLTRSAIASSIEQYQEALASLDEELDMQQTKLEDDEGLLHELNEVAIGLDRRKAVLSRRKTDDLTSVEKKLARRVANVEDDLGNFLRSLIGITHLLFVDDDGVQQAQLRHLIDQLINKAWDTPADPYVDVAQDYLPSIPAFLLRANVAVEHPRDAQRIRLIDFHRTTVA